MIPHGQARSAYGVPLLERSIVMVPLPVKDDTSARRPCRRGSRGQGAGAPVPVCVRLPGVTPGQTAAPVPRCPAALGLCPGRASLTGAV